MPPKTYLITGATSGIGKVMATEIVRQGHRVLIVARNEARGEEACREIQAEAAGHGSVEFMVTDLASLTQIAELCDRVNETCPRLDGLVNNAAVVPPKRQETVEGLEMQFAVNHLSYFLMAYHLKDLLLASAPARIVNTASEMHARGTLNLEDLQAQGSYRAFSVYSNTKLMNVYLTYSLAARLPAEKVTVNCWTPGLTSTGLGRHNNPAARLFFKLAGKSAKKGARTGIMLATDPALEGITGKYFKSNGKEAPTSKISRDETIREELWRVSEELTGMSGFYEITPPRRPSHSYGHLGSS